MHIEERTLDVSKKDGRSGQIKPVILRKGEENQTQIKINLTSNGEPYSVGNLTPRFCAILPDKKYVRDASHVTKSTNYVTYTVQSDLTSADGDIRVAYIELQSSGNSLTSDTLPIIVLDNTDISQEKAEEYQSQIDALVKDLENSINKANNAASNASSAATSANNAASSANSAKTNAQNAANSANTAASAADNAAMAADKATSKANTAADAANEAKQAVDEAMGKFTTVTDSEVKYQVGESGTTPPTGTWLTEPPTVPQGQYLWVRNTTSYNKGNPTVAYAVAFQGRDGSFAGDERIEELEKDIKNKQDKINFPGDPNKFLNGENEFIEVPFGELEDKVNKINDFTTGINLLRGTRDFRRGTKQFGTYGGHFKDGFNIASGYEFYEDEDGFTVAHIKHTGTNWKNIISNGVYLNTGDVVTVSFDFKVDDVKEATYTNGFVLPGAIEYYGTNSSSRISYTDMNILPSDIESGVWKKCLFTFTVPELSPEGKLYAIIRLQLALGGSIYFRKLCLYRGNIVNPEWSASPFDVASVQVENQEPIYLGNIPNERRIKSGDNLDTYMTAGVYACSDNSIVSSIVNKPSSVNYAFKLYVEYSNGAENSSYPCLRQRLVSYTEGAAEYIRFKETTTASWSDWRQTYANTTVRPIEGGGTGATTAIAARGNLMKGVPNSTAAIDNTSLILFAYGEPNTTNGGMATKNVSVLWDWIASKIESTYNVTKK